MDAEPDGARAQRRDLVFGDDGEHRAQCEAVADAVGEVRRPEVEEAARPADRIAAAAETISATLPLKLLSAKPPPLVRPYALTRGRTQPKRVFPIEALVITDRYVIDGAKMFITNAPVADLILLYVRTGAPGPLGLSCFLVERDTPGLRIGEPLDKMGLRTSPLGAVTLDGVRVPAARRVGREGAGFLILDHVMKREILLSFSITLGEMAHRLDRCVRQARTRTQFGQPIGAFQAVSHKVADMKIAVETARKWLYDTGAKVEAGEDAAIDVAATKTVVSEANLRTALDAVQIFGGAGYLTGTGVEADVRNAVGGTIYSGTNEVQRNRIAALLGLRPTTSQGVRRD